MPLPPRGQLNRADKVMSADEIDAFLTTSFCGRTATIGADGYPYVVPNLFVWHDSTVFLHTTRHPGHFAANVKNSDRISFEADEPGEVFPYGDIECDTSVSYRSAKNPWEIDRSLSLEWLPGLPELKYATRPRCLPDRAKSTAGGGRRRS
jgi:hypothetical protein